MTFYDRLKRLCVERGMSISRIIDKVPGLSVGSSTISYWKNGATPRPDKVKPIADYFGVSVGYLLGEEDSQTASAYPPHVYPKPITKKVPRLGTIQCGVLFCCRIILLRVSFLRLLLWFRLRFRRRW